MSEAERLDEGLTWMAHRFNLIYEVLRREHPHVPEHEIAALWNERMYRGKMPDAALDRAFAEIRRRGQAGLPPFGK
jgi:hypothetical protein